MKYRILKYTSQVLERIAIREIKILEMENEGPFVKCTTLENNHLYGSISIGYTPRVMLLIVYAYLLGMRYGPIGCKVWAYRVRGMGL